jgi:hypothetical protein
MTMWFFTCVGRGRCLQRPRRFGYMKIIARHALEGELPRAALVLNRSATNSTRRCWRPVLVEDQPEAALLDQRVVASR